MGHRGPIRQQADRLDAVEPAVDELIRRLVEADIRSEPLAVADEIILDIEVEGLRYVVLRCARRPADQRDPEPVAGPDLASPLSPRELEVARMVAKGYPNKSIASVLEISSWTVSSHLRRIYSKLGVTSRAAMVAHLLEDGRTEDSLRGPTHLTRGEPTQPRDPGLAGRRVAMPAAQRTRPASAAAAEWLAIGSVHGS